jgi:hypothetical protein
MAKYPLTPTSIRSEEPAIQLKALGNKNDTTSVSAFGNPSDRDAN